MRRAPSGSPIDLAGAPGTQAPLMARTSLPAALGLALGQLADPRILRVLAKSVLITLALLAALLAAGWFALGWAMRRWWPEPSEDFAVIVWLLFGIVGIWLLFRLIALAVINFFADEVVHAVEARHYPAARARAKRLPLGREMRNAARGGLRALLANALALPVALAFAVTGIGAPLVFLAVNAWLIGRELQDMVLLPQLAAGDSELPDEVSGEAQAIGAGTRLALGGIVAGLLIVPFINLVAPVLGAAAATHLIHRRAGRAA